MLESHRFAKIAPFDWVTILLQHDFTPPTIIQCKYWIEQAPLPHVGGPASWYPRFLSIGVEALLFIVPPVREECLPSRSEALERQEAATAI